MSKVLHFPAKLSFHGEVALSDVALHEIPILVLAEKQHKNWNLIAKQKQEEIISFQ